MGQDKALKPFLGRPLIQRVIERLTPIADQVIVTTNRPDEYTFLGLPLFPDLKPGRGALGGLYTALASASCDVVGVVACDMPFASITLFERMHSLLVEGEADVVIPRGTSRIDRPGAKGDPSQGLEPLHAVYRRAACLPAIEAAIAADQWKVIAWFPQVRVRVLEPGDVQRLDPSGLAFWNLNTPEEFAEAERRARLSDH